MNKREFAESMKGGYKLLLPRTDLELGYINGYRWGVEYPTNGKKPDLPDDVKCSVKFIGNRQFSFAVCSIDNWPFDQTSHFKIADEKYKPADTSYLVSEITISNCQYIGGGSGGVGYVSEIPESKSNAENVSNWYDYEAQKAVALPPVGIECLAEYDTQKNLWFRANIYYKNENCIVGRWLDGPAECRLFDYNFSWRSFKPLDHATRKAEAEKKRVVEAAFASLSEFNKAHQVLGELYDAGFLRMPAE